MSESDYLRLRDALSDPAYAGLSDADAAAALMAPETVWVDVPLAKLVAACRGAGITSRLEDLLVAHQTPSFARTAAKELVGLITSGNLLVLEMSNGTKRTPILAMLGALKGAEWITAEEETMIRALGQDQRPKCAAIGWEAVSAAEVARARGMA